MYSRFRGLQLVLYSTVPGPGAWTHGAAVRPRRKRPRGEADFFLRAIGATARAMEKEHLAAYSRFLSRKRDGSIAEVAAEFNETLSTRLLEDSYSVDDVADILNELLGVVRVTMKRDLSTVNRSSILLLKQVLEQAETGGLQVKCDLPATEDHGLLRTVEQWEESLQGSGVAAPLNARAFHDNMRSTARALPVIGQAQDPKLLSELQNTKDEAATLQERFNRLQVQCTEALREKSEMQAQLDAALGGGGSADGGEVEALRAEVDGLRAELDAAYAANQNPPPNSGENEGLMIELQRAQDANADLIAECDALRAEVNARVERSTPFMNLKNMLSKKNEIVRKLRDQLHANGIPPNDDLEAYD